MAAVDDIEAMNLQSGDGKAIKVRRGGEAKGRRREGEGSGCTVLYRVVSCRLVFLASLGRPSSLETGNPVSSPCAATGSASLVIPLPSGSAAWKSMRGRELDGWDATSLP